MGIICKETDSVPTCIICGAEYCRKMPNQVTCGSKKCRNALAKLRREKEVVDRVCVICGAVYPAIKSAHAKTCGPECRRILHSRSAENNIAVRARREIMAKLEDEAFPDPFETMETYNQEVGSWLCAEMTPLR